MHLQSPLIAVLICLSVLPVLAVFGCFRVSRFVAIVAIVVLWTIFPAAVVLTAVSYPEDSPAERQVNNRPIEHLSDQYVGSHACRSCHPHEHATWHSSYHRTMTQVATPETVVGDFDNVELKQAGFTFQLNRVGDEFWADIEGPGGPDFDQRLRERSRIVMSTGSHHMQAYWISTLEDTRCLRMFPFIYHFEQQRWVPRLSAFLTPPSGFPQDETGRWNETCIKCHTTHGQMRARDVEDLVHYEILDVDTRVAEFGIACEACHGPGESHVRANSSPTRRYRMYLDSNPDPTIVHPGRLSHQKSSQVCGQCHSIQLFRTDQKWYEWSQKGYEYRPGDNLEQSPMRFTVRCGLDPVPERLQSWLEDTPTYLVSMFWSDGMVRVSGREFNGLIETPCYQRGEMSCLSCHRMHQAVDDPRDVKTWANDQLGLEMNGNLACIQCHDDFEDQARLVEHTHHQAESSGSNCYNCHMSYTTYGLLKAIRSHQIENPDVATSLETGRPNACNQCHLDKSLGWTAEHLSNWYGMEKPELSSDDQSIAASVKWLLSGDAGQRALMAWSYGWEDAHQASGSDWMAPYLARLLEDPYDAVRYIASRSLRRLRAFENLPYDHLGSEAKRSLAHQWVLQEWQKQSQGIDWPSRPEVLIDDDGTLMQAEFDRFFGQRDDRDITLNE